MRKTQNKTYKGRQFHSTEAVCMRILRGYCVYVNDKFYPNLWSKGWRLSMLDRWVKEGKVFEAISTQTHQPYKSESRTKVKRMFQN